MADTGFPGDPFHEGSSKPLAHLQGSMAEVHTQAPLTSESMDNPRSAALDNMGQTWNTTSLAPAPAGTGNNDKMEAR
jgi:hypothetical protein